jgi:hypothetical protein
MEFIVKEICKKQRTHIEGSRPHHFDLNTATPKAAVDDDMCVRCE